MDDDRNSRRIQRRVIRSYLRMRHRFWSLVGLTLRRTDFVRELTRPYGLNRLGIKRFQRRCMLAVAAFLVPSILIAFHAYVGTLVLGKWLYPRIGIREDEWGSLVRNVESPGPVYAQMLIFSLIVAVFMFRLPNTAEFARNTASLRVYRITRWLKWAEIHARGPSPGGYREFRDSTAKLASRLAVDVALSAGRPGADGAVEPWSRPSAALMWMRDNPFDLRRISAAREACARLLVAIETGRTTQPIELDSTVRGNYQFQQQRTTRERVGRALSVFKAPLAVAVVGAIATACLRLLVP